MPLTVKDILEKTFKRSFKGYDEDEVDKFLDQIIDEFKELQNENAQMKNELTVLREQAKKVKDAEDTIMNTLVSAQKSAERIIGDASRKAELIISSAESTARSRADQATRELTDAELRLKELKSCAQGFATSFANMINNQAAHFERTYRGYFGQEDTPFGGGINTEALDRIDKDIARSMKDMPGVRDVVETPAHETPEPAAVQTPPVQEASEPAVVQTPLAQEEPEPAAMQELPPLAGEEPEPAPVQELPPLAEEEPEPADVPPLAEEEPEPAPVQAPSVEKKTEAAGDQAGFMELYEINKMLGEIESGDYPVKAEEDVKPADKTEETSAEASKAAPKGIGGYKPKYDDYSWIYENDDKPDDFSLSFKDPKEKEDLKTLIDEIID